MRKSYIGVLGFILVVMVFFTGACSDAGSQTFTGTKAPDFALKSTDGSMIGLSDTLQKRPAVLVFWATWCPACVHEVPDVERYYQKNGDKVAVIGVNIGESEKKVSDFIKKKGITYPVVLDRSGIVAQSYGVRGIPSVIAIDKNGEVLYYGHDIVEMARKTGLS